MKKSIIAAGAASVALAAMPIVGAFATLAEYSSITDKITLTVSKTCKMEADADLATTVADPLAKGTLVPLGTIAAGAAATAQSGTAMTITCNSASGWTLTATPTNMTTTDGYTIPFGTYTAGTQATSVWSAQVAITNNSDNHVVVDNSADAYATTAITTSGGVVAKNAADASDRPLATAGAVVTPSYIAYADSTQEAGNYTATIVYTFADLGA